MLMGWCALVDGSWAALFHSDIRYCVPIPCRTTAALKGVKLNNKVQATNKRNSRAHASAANMHMRASTGTASSKQGRQELENLGWSHALEPV